MHKIVALASGALSALQGAAHDATGQTNLLQWEAVAQQDARYTITLAAPLNLEIDNLYAGHRSHSSHSSHRSHSSHYSSSGGGGSYRYTPATPLVAPTPAPTRPTPDPSRTSPSRSPAPDTLAPSTTTRPTHDQLALIIMRVQAALFARGYDPGAINGQLNIQTRSAIASFQSAQGLQSTGTMTTETLNALGVRLSP